MQGLRKKRYRDGLVSNWPSASTPGHKSLTWFDLPESVRKKTLVAKSYPDMAPWLTPTKRKEMPLSPKEEKVVRSLNVILKKKLGVSIDNDMCFRDRVRCLVASTRWEIKR